MQEARTAVAPGNFHVSGWFHMKDKKQKDQEMAQFCVTCPVCTRARKKQRGIAYWFVKNIENGLCPYCAAYERVYGKKAHEA
jgi:transposase-like protein